MQRKNRKEEKKKSEQCQLYQHNPNFSKRLRTNFKGKIMKHMEVKEKQDKMQYTVTRD